MRAGGAGRCPVRFVRSAAHKVTIEDPASHYRLRYEEESHHLRGTLNGNPFWAVRQVVNRPACPAVP